MVDSCVSTSSKCRSAEMKEQLREAESRATPPEPESAHEERVDAIKEEARLAWQNIDRMQLQLEYPPVTCSSSHNQGLQLKYLAIGRERTVSAWLLIRVPRHVRRRPFLDAITRLDGLYPCLRTVWVI